uniref:EB domain-containing protein n=1 Tax=Romanomermis culicivorax TaxID=13658 RepID=A0A915JT31_ROMCU
MIPRYGQNCLDEINSVIYQCDESQYGVDYSCNLGSTKCSCKTAFTYNSTFDSCIPDLGNYLYQDCSNDLDCIGLAFATCRNGKCLCRQHFTENSRKLCEAETLTCPTLDHDIMKPTKSTCYMFMDQDQEFHNCGPQHFCLLHNGEYDEQGMPVGHCCPERKESISRIGSTCATSPPDNRTCNEESSPKHAELCPMDTHECVPQPYRRDKVCCPKPCRTGALAISGYCYYPSRLDKPCTFDIQCPKESACTQCKLK